MCKVIIFAGTTEGRELSEYLDRQKVSTMVCVATEYGESLLKKSDYLSVSGKRLTEEEMEQLFETEKPVVVVDATHPYATVVSAHIKEACKAKNTAYIRLLREETKQSETKSDLVYVDSVAEACAYLEDKAGNVFITTGSKELKEYMKLSDYKERTYARVLSSKEAMQQVMELGFEGKNLICMQGPFSEEMNYIMLKEINAKYLVTKEAGRAGGFLEKINAAKRLNITSIVIGRPKEEEGFSYFQVVKHLNEMFSLKSEPREISVVGIGMGSLAQMTREAEHAVREADVVFGASRMLETVEEFGKPAVPLYKKEEIDAFLKEHLEYRKIVVLVSGDVGFYSAASGLSDYFAEYKTSYVCGISSLSYFCGKIAKPWEAAKLISAHGRQVNTVDIVRRNDKVFSLMGGDRSVVRLMQELLDYGFEELLVWVGENLGYETEKITYGSPRELAALEFDKLCVVYIENPNARADGERIKDEAFLRGDVPMTKEEIRTVALSKLELEKGSILYDIGAGTGSVSIQAAQKAYEGVVYAVEKNAEGILLIEENKKRFQVSNVWAVEGVAPEALWDLPAPTHAFIGGSGGKLGEMIRLLQEKNPQIKIVITAITLETVSEAMQGIKELAIKDYEVIQLQCARAKKAGPYHMMMGQNPVTVITIG
ncbi:precorrin-6A reductase [Konateibacter massiliensis]|uniref:precorrin-6A reductase n=1 Tax=Konateibacter massiliensis TaxID=2002841 RepID=UPI000C14A777|nr:precorrin-6A reductase [Konateibacter massiliensis]